MELSEGHAPPCRVSTSTVSEMRLSPTRFDADTAMRYVWLGRRSLMVVDVTLPSTSCTVHRFCGSDAMLV